MIRVAKKKLNPGEANECFFSLLTILRNELDLQRFRCSGEAVLTSSPSAGSSPYPVIIIAKPLVISVKSGD